MTATPAPASPRRIQALVRADALLSGVVTLGSGAAVSLSELAAYAGLHKVTAFNLLRRWSRSAISSKNGVARSACVEVARITRALGQPGKLEAAPR